MFQIGRNKLYNRKNEIPMKIPELKMSRIGIIVEFHGIPTKFPNQGWRGEGGKHSIVLARMMDMSVAVILRGVHELVLGGCACLVVVMRHMMVVITPAAAV
jgi:hypothetical protein